MSGVTTKPVDFSPGCFAGSPSCVDKKTVIKIILLIVAMLGVGGCIALGVWGEVLLPELYQTTSQMIALTSVLGGIGGGSALATLIWTIIDCVRAHGAASSSKSVKSEDTVSVQGQGSNKLRVTNCIFSDNFRQENFCYITGGDKTLVAYGKGLPEALENKQIATLRTFALEGDVLLTIMREQEKPVMTGFFNGAFFFTRRLEKVTEEKGVLMLQMIHKDNGGECFPITPSKPGASKIHTIHIQHEGKTVVTLSYPANTD
jgi:hypothetical protein